MMENNNQPDQDKSRFDMSLASQRRLAEYLQIADHAGAREDFKTQKSYLDNVFTTIYTFIERMDDAFKKELFQAKDRAAGLVSGWLQLRNEISRPRFTPMGNEIGTFQQTDSNLKSNLFKYDLMLKAVLQANNLLFPKEKKPSRRLPEVKHGK